MTARLQADVITVSGRVVYTCRVCGREGVGRYEHFKTYGLDGNHMEEASRQLRAYSMPYDWASYSGGEHACPEHKV